MTRKLSALLVCAVVVLAVPAHTEAQGIKGLIKKKVTSEAKGEDNSSNQSKGVPKAGPVFQGDLIELNEPVLNDFIAAHALENRLIREFRQQLARYKPDEEVKACKQKVAMTPEAQKIMMQIGSAGENPTAADMQRIIEKMNREIEVLVKSKCGESLEATWPPYKRSQRLAEFRKTASLAFDSALDARAAARSRGGPFVGEFSWGYQEPSQKYPNSDERTIAFCRLKDANKLVRDPRGFWFGEGDSPGNYFIFSDAEYDALSKKCKQMEHEEEVG